MPKNTTDPRLSGIADEFRAASSAVIMADHEKTQALADAQDRSSDAVSAREETMHKLAVISRRHNLTEKELLTVTKLAAKGANDERTAKSLGTYLSEAKRAAHPAVRDLFEHMVNVRDQACDDEDDARKADKNADTPIRRAFSRRYHVLVRVMGEAIEGRPVLTVDALVEFARANDPAHNIERVLGKLGVVMDTLREIGQSFPDADIAAAADLLGHITEADLRTARKVVEEAITDSQSSPAVEPENEDESESESAPTPDDVVARALGELFDEDDAATLTVVADNPEPVMDDATLALADEAIGEMLAA